jgi:hypothetical protein
VSVTSITPSNHRADYVKGLRALADILEASPEVPLPYTGSVSEIAINAFLHSKDPRAAIVATVRAFTGVAWDKETRDGKGSDDSYFDMLGSLHGLRLRLTSYRDAVCERVVTGTREVTETVKDPAKLAEVPEIEVTKTVEEVEWRCAPILKPVTVPEGPEAA